MGNLINSFSSLLDNYYLCSKDKETEMGRVSIYRSKSESKYIAVKTIQFTDLQHVEDYRRLCQNYASLSCDNLTKLLSF